MWKWTFQVFSTVYYLTLKHFYCAMHVVQSAVLLLLLLLFLVAHSEIHNLNTSLSIDITQSNAVKWKYQKYPIYIKNVKSIEKVRYFQYFQKYRDIFHPWRDLNPWFFQFGMPFSIWRIVISSKTLAVWNKIWTVAGWWSNNFWGDDQIISEHFDVKLHDFVSRGCKFTVHWSLHVFLEHPVFSCVVWVEWGCCKYYMWMSVVYHVFSQRAMYPTPPPSSPCLVFPFFPSLFFSFSQPVIYVVRSFFFKFSVQFGAFCRRICDSRVSSFMKNFLLSLSGVWLAVVL